MISVKIKPDCESAAQRQVDHLPAKNGQDRNNLMKKAAWTSRC
jgi:hypothetical protein